MAGRAWYQTGKWGTFLLCALRRTVSGIPAARHRVPELLSREDLDFLREKGAELAQPKAARSSGFSTQPSQEARLIRRAAPRVREAPHQRLNVPSIP